MAMWRAWVSRLGVNCETSETPVSTNELTVTFIHGCTENGVLPLALASVSMPLICRYSIEEYRFALMSTGVGSGLHIEKLHNIVLKTMKSSGERTV